MDSRRSDAPLTSPFASQVAGAVASLMGTGRASDLVRGVDTGRRRGGHSLSGPVDSVRVPEAPEVLEARAGTGRARAQAGAAAASAGASAWALSESCNSRAADLPDSVS